MSTSQKRSPWLDNPPLNVSPLRFLIFVSRPYWLPASIALCLVVCGAILNTVSAYVFKMIVNAATTFNTTQASEALWSSAFLYILVSLGGVIVWRLSGFVGAYWATGARATARYTLSSYVTLHSNQYFSNRFAGSTSSKVASAATCTRDMVETILWSFVGFVVVMAVSLTLLLFTNIFLALIFLFWVLIITPLNVWLARGRVPFSSAYQKAETALGGATVDMLANMLPVHEYTNRPFELTRLKTLITDRREKGMRNSFYGEKILTINGLLETLFISGLLLTAIYLAIHGHISPGDIALVLTLVIIVQDRLTFIGTQLSRFADSWGQIEESLEDILIEQDIPDKKDAKQLSTHSSSITFDSTTFKYGETTVFDNLSLTIPQGQKVGLVGRSGAGKSTLVKLLLRHYDITSGSIRIGEENIASVTKDSLRRAIAVVPQEPLLFHRSIRDNIAYGKPGATMDEVVRAATLAEAHEFIEKVTGGYNALVGERGVKLSGGQRQRIVIARAILKDAPILLLDEATSALDSESEGAVQKALFTLMENRTVIAIAHRLSTLRAMDRIIVMDEGKIIEDGTHDELIAKDGVYAMLWNHQAGGFIEE